MHLRTTLKNSLRVWIIEIRLPGRFLPGLTQVRGRGVERRNCLQLHKATSPYDPRSASKCVSSGGADGSTTGLSSRGPRISPQSATRRRKKKKNTMKRRKKTKTTCEATLQEAAAQHLRRGSLCEWPPLVKHSAAGAHVPPFRHEFVTWEGGHCGDSDEDAQSADALSALVKVSSLKNEITKRLSLHWRGMNPRKTVSVELRTCATQRFSPPPLLMSLYRKAELKVFVTPPGWTAARRWSEDDSGGRRSDLFAWCAASV